MELDSMTATDIEENIQVASFLSTVNEPKQAKMLREKKATKKSLDESRERNGTRPKGT